MKRNLYVVVALLVLIFLSVSCENNIMTETGSLEIKIDNTVRGLEPNISLKTDTYRITVTAPNGESGEYSLSPNAEFGTLKGLMVGTWNIKVEALNLNGDVIGEGTEKVNIEKDKINSVSVTVKEVSGEGTLTVTIAGNNPNNSTYSLSIKKNNSGTLEEVTKVDFTNVNGVLKAEVSLDNGFYSFQIESSSSKETVPAPEAVRIVKGDSISVEYEIQTSEMGDGKLTIVDAIVPTPSLKLKLSSSLLKEGDSLTVTAEGMVGTFEWFLDKKKIEGAVTNTVTIDSLSVQGEYEITCIVHDSASIIWSESKSFEVHSKDYRPQSVTLKGSVEFYLASDVLVPRGLYYVNLYDGGSRARNIRHYINYYEDEATFTCSLDEEFTNEGYYYYFETEYLESENKTLVLIVIDKELESYGYLNITNETNYDLTPYNKYVGKFICRDGYIPILPYNKGRTIKLEVGTYEPNNYGYTGDNVGFVWPKMSKDYISIKEGETTELKAYSTYGTITFENSNFKEDETYWVYLMNGANYNRARFRAEQGKLKVNIDSSSYSYDKILIVNVNNPDCYYETTEVVSNGNSITVPVENTAMNYVDSGVNIPAGRVVVDADPRVLIGRDTSFVFWNIKNGDNTLVDNNLDSNWSDDFYLNSSGRLYYKDISSSNYDISVTTEEKSDSNGSYTLVKFTLDKDFEHTGTLVVNYDIPENIELSTNNRSSVGVYKNSGKERAYIPVKSNESITLKLEAGSYSQDGWWSRIYDTSGKEYYPTFTPENFVIREGETTTITVTLEEYFD